MDVEKKIEVDVELKSPADLFYKSLREEFHHLATASPENIQGVKVHEGDHKTPGSIKEWSYTIDGKQEVFKEQLEVDEEAKLVSLVAVDGHILQQYKTYKAMYQVIPKDNEPAIGRVILAYEKFKDTDPDPHNYLKFCSGLVKALDEHLMAKMNKGT